MEAIRNAQGKFGAKPLTGEEIRWGIESLDVTEERIKELGAEGLMSPLKVSCADHEGGGAVKFLEWTGTRWKEVTDWIETDKSTRRPDDPGVLPRSTPRRRASPRAAGCRWTATAADQHRQPWLTTNVSYG